MLLVDEQAFGTARLGVFRGSLGSKNAVETRKVRNRYNEGDGTRDRNWHCAADTARDRDRKRGIDSDREHTQTLETREPFMACGLLAWHTRPHATICEAFSYHYIRPSGTSV